MNSIQQIIYDHLKNDIKKELIDELEDENNQRYIDLINQEVDQHFKDNEIVLEEEESAHISSSHRPRVNYTMTEKTCIARVWNRSDTGQCSRNKCNESYSFCTIHHKKVIKFGYWWLGNIDEPIQECYEHYNKITHYPINYSDSKRTPDKN